jgi:electron transfer flavoprotein beta subunit
VIGAEVQPDGKTIQVKRELEAGLNETVQLQLPALITIQYGANQPRYASLKGIMAAKKKPFVAWKAADVGLEANQVGAAGAMYEVKNVFVPERKSRVEILSGTPEEEVTQLVEKLRKEAKVL